MKIALMSKEFINNDINFNTNQIISSIQELKGQVDLICFGEAFLQGFDSLSWKYEIDKDIAISLDSMIIENIKKVAYENQVAVAFGYIEKCDNRLYCSYLFIDRNGKIINNYRRVSKGWKEYFKTDQHYCEGESFSSYEYLNKRFVTALCGDLWDNDNIKKIDKIEKDIVIWPLYVNYSLSQWKKEKEDYLLQASTLKVPVLFINSKCIKENSYGGCYLFNNNKIDKALELGNEGVLIVEV